MTVIRSMFFLAGIAATLPAIAQTADTPTSSFGIGGGLGVRPSVYAGDDDRVRALPLINYRSRWLNVSGATADVPVFSGPLGSIGLRAQYALGDGYDAGDSPVFSGMPDRKESFWLGVSGEWRTDYANFNASWLTATGRSKGQRLRFGVDRDFAQGNWRFTPRAALTWQDDKAVDYYYGVDSQYATAARPAYEASSNISTELGLRAAYGFDRHHSVFVDVSATHLGSEIADSPLVDRSWVPAVGLGYLYRF